MENKKLWVKLISLLHSIISNNALYSSSLFQIKHFSMVEELQDLINELKK